MPEKRDRYPAEGQTGSDPLEAVGARGGPLLSEVVEAIDRLNNTLRAVEAHLATSPPTGTPAATAKDIATADNVLELLEASLALDDTPITITDVTPAQGDSAGGTAVTIRGTNFVSGVAVFFGENAATDVTVIDGAQMTVKTPPAPTAPGYGTGDLVVDVAVEFGNVAIKPGGFSYRRRAH
jgi:hypothetical protein